MDIVDIAIVAFAIYKIIDFIRKTRAQQLLKGLLILVAIMFLSSIFNLYTVHFLLYNGLIYGFTAIIVIFYPELRRATGVSRTEQISIEAFCQYQSG